MDMVDVGTHPRKQVGVPDVAEPLEVDRPGPLEDRSVLRRQTLQDPLRGDVLGDDVTGRDGDPDARERERDVRLVALEPIEELRIESSTARRTSAAGIGSRISAGGGPKIGRAARSTAVSSSAMSGSGDVHGVRSPRSNSGPSQSPYLKSTGAG